MNQILPLNSETTTKIISWISVASAATFFDHFFCSTLKTCKFHQYFSTALSIMFLCSAESMQLHVHENMGHPWCLETVQQQFINYIPIFNIEQLAVLDALCCDIKYFKHSYLSDKSKFEDEWKNISKILHILQRGA